MSIDKLERAKRVSRRITTEDRMEANLRMFEQLALDIDDVERMAESVGLEADDLLLLNTHVSVSAMPRRIIGKPGRRNTTMDIADFAAVRRERGITWNEIFVEWKQQYPDDDRVKSPETLRDAYRRHYGDKAGKPY